MPCLPGVFGSPKVLGGVRGAQVLWLSGVPPATGALGRTGVLGRTGALGSAEMLGPRPLGVRVGLARSGAGLSLPLGARGGV